ncbi:ATP-binding protein [Beduinella massiliensis]|uniref:ATP-binding protein n=1 Tax=Beduinella massiliensis TaxID=1852363 RepID=UPI0011AF29E8
MSRVKKQTWLLIAGYTLLLSLSIVLCFYLFVRNSGADTSALPKILFYAPSGQTILDSSVTSAELHDYFRAAFFRYLPVLVASVCLLVLLFSCVLLLGFCTLERRHNRVIASDLRDLTEAELERIREMDLKEEYQGIHARLSAYEEDQRRLHSFIAHEQKNMIMLIKARLDQNSDPLLVRDIEKLAQSVDDILTVSAHRDSSHETVDLALIAAEECDAYRNIYSDLIFSFDENASYTILGKEQWLRRAVDNLLDNAVKYGGGNPIEVTLEQQHNSVLLHVRDHGAGMSEDEAELVFGYGYQIRALNKDGYGIGLSLVQHVCALCDGFIRVNSKKGRGSEFVLAFPLNR